MSEFYDALETRSADERLADLARDLPKLLAAAKALTGYAGLADVDPAAITSPTHLADLPVLRKSELSAAQKATPPLGGYAKRQDFLFQSPGPIYEPGMAGSDWWRIARFLHAAGMTADDVVQNCFSYHFTPAGKIFESGALAIGATVFPAGTGQTELQVRAAADIGATAYAGTPDYLNVILEKAREMGVTLGFTKATVGGGPLFPAMRQAYEDQGITCLQNYATADLGNVAYESKAKEGMIVDEGVIVEIVTPGTGDPVAPGEVGEVVVTCINLDYPLIRFATGDLSSVLPGESPCGRTNMRIRGWQGRADQAAKVKGMFVRPEQVADLVKRHDAIEKARVIITHENNQDIMTVKVETDQPDLDLSNEIRETMKLRGNVEAVTPGSLPRDGIVIEDKREFG